jgi:co-chaperonin GroES (HSP10)
VEATVEKDGKIHPCNGYMLIETHDQDYSGLVVVHDPTSKDYKSGVVIEMSGDQIDADLKVEDWEWKLGDLVFFSEVIEIDGSYFVHWTDVVAYKRF